MLQPHLEAIYIEAILLSLIISSFVQALPTTVTRGNHVNFNLQTSTIDSCMIEVNVLSITISSST